MTTQVSQSLIQETNKNMFNRLWTALTQPAASVKGDDRRRATSLSALTLVFIPLATFAVMFSSTANLLDGGGFTINAGGLIGISLIVCAYLISRTRYFLMAAYVTITIPVIAVSIALIREGVISESALVYLTLSVILSSLLLTSRDTILSGIFVILSVLALFRVLPNGDVAPLSIIIYTIVATGVMALISRIRENNLEALELAQSQLKEQVEKSEEARIRAERSDQVKSSFLASMSHELRTPLNAIINFTRFVSKGTLGPVNEDQVETLDNVIISGKNLLNLINDVLDMAKIESGSLTLFVSDDVAVDEIIKEVGVTGRALLDEKPIELTTEIEAGLPQIRGDHQRIRQVFLNIISNACKFTDEGAIKIIAKKQADNILISISDTGFGIAKEDQEMVFEAFKQTNAGLRQGGGTGLGMPITKSLIEAHGGTIGIESQTGKGTTFHITLPIKSTTISPTLITEI